MEWESREESRNVEDRRGTGMKTGIALGGGGIIVLIFALLFGIDPQRLGQVLRPADDNVVQDGGQRPNAVDPAEERLARFTKVVFRDTEVVWDELFKNLGKNYHRPVLVLFSGRVDSACGLADAAIGPFYCPEDSRIYIDLSFYKDMERKLNAPGEFARAYVVAHEVGHHVQRLLGYADFSRLSFSRREKNQTSVRLELQADFLAGVWAHHGQRRLKFLEKGDIDAALNAAWKIGDDYLQRQSRGVIVPDAFTHGTSRQRSRWFKDGFDTGDLSRARLLISLPYEEL